MSGNTVPDEVSTFVQEESVLETSEHGVVSAPVFWTVKSLKRI